MADHAVYSPSAMHRIIQCPASVMASTYVPVKPPSQYALAGTMKHEWVEVIWKDPNGLLKLDKSSLSDEDKQQILTCVDYLRALKMATKMPMVDLEQKVSLDAYGLPEVWGTADVVIHGVDEDLGYVLRVVDWKFGSGVQVVAEDNEQLMTYALGALAYTRKQGWEIEHVQMHIVQPPLGYEGIYTVNPPVLEEWAKDVLYPAIQEAKKPDPPFRPSKKACRFCPASMQCKARYQFVQGAATAVFEAYSALPTITPEQLSDALLQADIYEDYVKQLRLYAHDELLKGRPVPKWKLVAGRSNRKWKDEQAAIEWLEDHSGISGENLWEQKFVSPSKAEKLNRKLKKDEHFQNLITKPPGKPQLAKETDKRPALTPTADAADAFADYADD